MAMAHHLFSTGGDIEFADVRALLRGRDRNQGLFLLEGLYCNLYQRLSGTGVVEDFDDLVARLEVQSKTSPATCLLIAGRRLREHDAEILAFAAGDFYPRSRCALITHLGVDEDRAPKNLWIGVRSVTEVLRGRLVDALEGLAGGRLKGLFAECRDPEAEGIELDDWQARDEWDDSCARAGIARSDWELQSLPIHYATPEWALGGLGGGHVVLCSCADRIRRHCFDPKVIKAFLAELWAFLGGRRAAPKHPMAFAMMEQASLL
jgi:hypothetical protein